MLRNNINQEAKKKNKKMWIAYNYEEIYSLMKFTQQDKTYKLIKQFFNKKETQCTHIKDK